MGPGSKILHQLNKLIPDHVWPPSWGNRLTVKAGFHEVEPGPKTKGQLTECEHKITNKCWWLEIILAFSIQSQVDLNRLKQCDSAEKKWLGIIPNWDDRVWAGPAAGVLHQRHRHPRHRLPGHPWQCPLPDALHIQVQYPPKWRIIKGPSRPGSKKWFWSPQRGFMARVGPPKSR